MTQTQLAKLLGMHPMTVSKLERQALPLDDELRNKLLMLIEISELPGAAKLLRHVAHRYAGNDALFLATAIHKTVT